MTARYRRFTAAVLFVAASASLDARQSPAQGAAVARYLDAERGSTIDGLVELALQKAPAILAARARIEVAKGELAQTSLQPNPTASFEWRDQAGGPDNQATFGFTWPIDTGRRSRRTAIAQEDVARVEHGVTNDERRLAAAVRLQAVAVLAAIRQVDVRERIVEAAGQTRDLLAARAESGAGPPLDRDVAEVEWRRAQGDLVRERANADRAVVALKALVGVPPDEPLLLRDPLDSVVGTAPGVAVDAAAIARALDARPDVRAADSEVTLAKVRSDLIRREGRPDVSLAGSYMRMDAGFAQFGLDASGRLAPIRGVFHNVAIGATVTVPWFNRQQGALAASTAAEQAARLERDASRLTASTEIAAARVREAEARRVWEIYTGGLRDLAAKNLDVVRESHKLGRATLVEVLAEVRRYLEIETAYTDALVEFIDARIALGSAMGVVR